MNFDNSNKNFCDYFEKFPIIVFENLLNSKDFIGNSRNSQVNILQIQTYIIIFLTEYFKSYGKKNLEEKKIYSLKDSGLIHLLLRKRLFIIEIDEHSLVALIDRVKNN